MSHRPNLASHPEPASLARLADHDLALIRRVAGGDREAFETLYHRYYRRLFGYLLRLTRRVELVDEVLNDVMLVVWRRAASFDRRSRLSTWIFGIAYHKALKALSRLGSAHLQPPDVEGSSESFGEAVGEGPQERIERRELAGAIELALASLSPEQRAVVELTYFHELSYREIAEITGAPVNTVKTRMFHARRRLRQLLPGLGAGTPALREEKER